MPRIKYRKAYAGKRAFVVEMLRYGNREAHSYIIGVWRDYTEALKEAKHHMELRGGKYDCEIHEVMIDSPSIELYRKACWSDLDKEGIPDLEDGDESDSNT